MMSLEIDYSCSFNPKTNKGIIDEDDSIVPYSSDNESCVSSDSDLFGESEDDDEVISNSSPTSASTSPSGPLQDLSSLFQQLPIKRGLSKHYSGKSQSFTSLANVSSLEDLAKPENPFNKRLKACKSYGGFLEMHRSDNHPPRSASSSRLVSKRASSSRLGPSSSPSVRRNGSFLGNKPPTVPPNSSTSKTNFGDQNTPLFA